MIDFLSVVPFAVVSSAVTWATQAWAYRDKRKAAHADQSDKLEIHRDQFTLELLQNARTEITLVRTEINSLREEQGTLRKLEQHVYHFQESLEHLELLLLAETTEALTQAKRNATAFLKRMRRLQDAKGTILNEVQIRAAEQHVGVTTAGATTTIKTPEDKGHG